MRAIRIGLVALCMAGVAVGASGCRHKHKKADPANVTSTTTTTTTNTTGS